MKKLMVVLVLSLGGLQAEEIDWQAVSRPRPVASESGRNLWRASVGALAVANAMDVHSSWGKRELNGTLAGPAGNFGGSGALIKLAIQGGLVGFEHLLLRQRGDSDHLYRVLSLVNIGAASVTSAVAAHNYSIPRR